MILYVPREHLNWFQQKTVHVVTVVRQQPFKCGEATWINKVVSTFKRQKNPQNTKKFKWQYYKDEELLNKEASTLKESINFPEAFL